MREHGGAIVNIVADIWGSMPNMGHSGAARAGMVSFTETAAVEWAHNGVRVNAVAPGYIASSGMDHYPPEAGPMLREMRKTVPLGRFGTEAETSAAVVFLLSPAASFISGDVLRVDGARPQVRMGWPMEVPDAAGAAARRGQAVRRLSPRGQCTRRCSQIRRKLTARMTMPVIVVLERARRARAAAPRSDAGAHRATAGAGRTRGRGVGQIQAGVRQARPVAAARARGAVARSGRALPAAVLAGRVSAGHQGRGRIGARRRHRGGHRIRQRRALHGGRERLGHRRRRHPADGAGQDPAGAGARAGEQAAVHPPGGERRRQPDALPRRGFRARRRAVPQPGAAVGGGHSGDHRAARLGHRGRRLHAGAVATWW